MNSSPPHHHSRHSSIQLHYYWIWFSNHRKQKRHWRREHCLERDVLCGRWVWQQASFERAYQVPQSESVIPVVISSLVALVRSDAPQNPIHFISLIGVAVAVLVRLKHTTTPANERLPKELQVSSNCSNKLSTHGMHVRSKLLSFILHSSSCPGHLFQFMFWYVWSWPFAIGDKNGWSSPL